MDAASAGLVRSLIFFSCLGYPPTLEEWISGWDAGPDVSVAFPSETEVRQAATALVDAGGVVLKRGRCFFKENEIHIGVHEAREALFPRKVRVARRAVRWLSRLSGVRFVALCNTTALTHARDAGDLDFFIITKRGSLWQTRALAVLPFSLAGRRPDPHHLIRDAVCLSFFVDDAHLSLDALQLDAEDVYFRHWFLSLLPLFDDGIGHAFWEANQALKARHPFARPWVSHTELAIRAPVVRVPTLSCAEGSLSRLQRRTFPPSIRALANRDTRVVIADGVLKFHVEDGRASYWQAYHALCLSYGVAP